MKSLIFLDIDGTILSRGGVHPRTRKAMEDAIAQGHIVMINTGRALGNIPADFLRSLPLSGVVAGLGVYIRHKDEILLSRAMTDEEISFAMQIADEYDATMVFEGEAQCFNYHGIWYGGDKNDITSVEEMHAKIPGIRVSKAGYIRPLPEEAVNRLAQRFSVFNHPTYAEIGLKGYSKATAIEFLQKHFGVDRAHVIAMGDSLNDVEMLQAAGTAVVMGDGLESVKEIADFVSLPAYEGGVGYAIEELVLKQK